MDKKRVDIRGQLLPDWRRQRLKLKEKARITKRRWKSSKIPKLDDGKNKKLYRRKTNQHLKIMKEKVPNDSDCYSCDNYYEMRKGPCRSCIVKKGKTNNFIPRF